MYTNKNEEQFDKFRSDISDENYLTRKIALQDT